MNCLDSWARQFANKWNLIYIHDDYVVDFPFFCSEESLLWHSTRLGTSRDYRFKYEFPRWYHDSQSAYWGRASKLRLLTYCSKEESASRGHVKSVIRMILVVPDEAARFYWREFVAVVLPSNYLLITSSSLSNRYPLTKDLNTSYLTLTSLTTWIGSRTFSISQNLGLRLTFLRYNKHSVYVYLVWRSVYRSKILMCT